ncbi:MAG: hypothetical protein EOO11_17800 [Chitinophagaceae bacterium]|nr:MAG: hypothetical protein EOO11_17800 [Chitinophagaceae bacterium]
MHCRGCRTLLSTTQ